MRDGVGDPASVVAAHDVQAEVDPCGAARRREHAASVDVEHVGVDRDLGMALGERGRVAPVCRCLSAVEQSGGGDEEGPAADRDQPRAALVRRAQGGDHRRRRFAVPAGNDDRVSRLERLEPVLDEEGEPAGGGRQRPRSFGRDSQLVPPGNVELGPLEPEDLDDDAELERGNPGGSESDDPVHVARS
jgi:hypothetical protein